MSSPNLFSFATSELSQDAFICWLLSWADPEYAASDPALHKTGCLLVTCLLDVGKVTKPAKYERVKVQKQVHHIDVLVTINDQIAIIIEDKTFTKHHSDQLERYRAEVANTFSPENIASIYFKTGDQCSYEEVEKAGYHPFLRAHFLGVLEQGRQLGVDNHTYRDFELHLTSVEDAVKSFRIRGVADWDWHCWVGFFIELQDRLRDGAWDYVPNPSGGFMGFWWHWRQNKYLQLEEGKLCFKIEVAEKALRASEWEEWHTALVAAASSNQLAIKRPGRRGSGTWMTVATAEDDYRRKNADGTIDIDETIRTLRAAESILDNAGANALLDDGENP